MEGLLSRFLQMRLLFTYRERISPAARFRPVCVWYEGRGYNNTAISIEDAFIGPSKGNKKYCSFDKPEPVVGEDSSSRQWKQSFLRLEV